MKKQENKQNLILLKMLRERQAKQNIVYLTTDHSVYKCLRILFGVLLALCTVLALIFLLGQWGGLQANLSHAEQLSDLQQTEIAEIKNGIYTVGIMSALLLLSEVFLRLRKPILQMIFTLLPGIVLIATYAARLSDALDSGDYSSFVWKHLLPIGLLMLCSTLAAVLHLRQRIKDKKGCNEISEEIYRRYSVMADAITPEQWERILAEAQPAPPKSKKRSVKNRLRKEKAKGEQLDSTEAPAPKKEV